MRIIFLNYTFLSIVISFSILSHGQYNQVGLDIDGVSPGDRCGYSVAISDDGTIVAVGSPEVDDLESGVGHVRVYQRINDEWIQIGDTIVGVEIYESSGQSIDLSADGSVLAVGSFGQTGGDYVSTGQVRVFEFDGDNWIQKGSTIYGPELGDSFHKVSLSDDGLTLVAGAFRNDYAGDEAGLVRAYDFELGDWTQFGEDILGETEGDFFGFQIEVSGDGNILAVGAENHNYGGNSDAGQVKVYRRVDDTWEQIGDSFYGDGSLDNMGEVGLNYNGSILGIGIPGEDNMAGNAGQVRVYEWNSGSWLLLGDYIDGENEVDRMGCSVNLSNDGMTLSIGGSQASFPELRRGVMRNYRYCSGNWNKIGDDIKGEYGGDLFGLQSDLSGNGKVFIAGGYENFGGGESAGHARIFERKMIRFEDGNLIALETGEAYQWLNCDLGFEIIEGATEPTYTPESNGNYAVEITDENGCVDTSACYEITYVNITEVTRSFSVYPNPTSGNFIVENNFSEEIQYIQVLSVHGKLIESRAIIDQGINNFNINHYTSGIYLVKILYNQKSSEVIKLIKH